MKWISRITLLVTLIILCLILRTMLSYNLYTLLVLNSAPLYIWILAEFATFLLPIALVFGITIAIILYIIK